MAQPTTYKGSSVGIYLEDSGNPGTYLKPCGLSENSFSFNKNLNEVNVPDCDDPDLPQWVQRDVESLDFSASGSGILAAEAVDTWDAAWRDTNSVNARVYVGLPTDTTKGRFWAGKVHVSGFEVNGVIGDKVRVSISLVSDGEVTFNVTA